MTSWITFKLFCYLYKKKHILYLFFSFGNVRHMIIAFLLYVRQLSILFGSWPSMSVLVIFSAFINATSFCFIHLIYFWPSEVIINFVLIVFILLLWSGINFGSFVCMYIKYLKSGIMLCFLNLIPFVISN